MAGDVGSTSLGDLCDPDRGITYGIVKVGEFVSDGVPVIRGGDIRNGRIEIDHEKRVSTEVSQQFQRTILRGGELVINLIAEPGHTAIVPPELAGSNVSRDVGVIPLNTSVDHRYVDYCLKSPMAIQWLTSRLQGSVTQKINLATLRDVPIPTPPLAEQRAIAHILGTLDDKIELNRRMNETLEAMARALFKSWFVDFDPVRAKAEGSDSGLPKPLADLFPDSFEDSELGEIPKGWKTGVVDDLAVISSGKRPEVRYTEPSAEANVPLWGGNGPMAFVPFALITCPILLTGRVGTLGSVFRITTPCWPSDNTLIVQPRHEMVFEYIFFQLREIDFTSLNRGSTQPLLTQSDLKVQPLVLPPEQLLRGFHAATCKVCSRIDASRAQSQTLADLRDTLLPKLISGELRVTAADDFVQEATA